MKKLVLLLFVVLGGCSPKSVATLTRQPNRLLYASSDIDRISTVDSIARIKTGSFFSGRNVKLTLRTGGQATVPKQDIWGYTDEKGNVWRRFRKSFYQVIRVDEVVEYEIVESRNVGHNIVVYEPVKMYSKTLDSKIVGSRKRALQTIDDKRTD